MQTHKLIEQANALGLVMDGKPVTSAQMHVLSAMYDELCIRLSRDTKFEDWADHVYCPENYNGILADVQL